MEELKACPFCGSTVVLRENYTIGSNTPGYIVKCMMCGCGLSHHNSFSKESVVHHWNTRPIEDALRARIAALEAAGDRLFYAADLMATGALRDKSLEDWRKLRGTNT